MFQGPSISQIIKELNIFTEPQALPVEKFRFIFRHGGSTESTECAMTETVENVWFITGPFPEQEQ